MNFEENYKRVEQIATILEKENISLEESSKLFEESIILVQKLQEELQCQKGKILQLKIQAEKLTEEDMN